MGGEIVREADAKACDIIERLDISSKGVTVPCLQPGTRRSCSGLLAGGHSPKGLRSGEPGRGSGNTLGSVIGEVVKAECD